MQGPAPQVTVSEILSAWFAGLGRHASVCLLASGALTAVGMVLDLTLGDTRSTLPNAIVGFIVQYHLVEYVMSRDFGLRPAKRHYGSAFGAMLLGTLGMMGGLVLLVIPGLYMAARWTLSNPLIVGEEYPTIEALKESWRRTQASAWPIVGCFLVVGLMLGLAMAVFAGIMVTPVGGGSLIPALLANGLGAMFSVVVSILSVAIYGLIAKPEGALDDVFS